MAQDAATGIEGLMREKLVLLMVLLVPLLGATATLTWNPNTESDLAGYRIYQGTITGQYGPPTDVGLSTTYTVTLPQLTIDQTYFFAVTAYDLANNESLKSSEVSKLVTGIPNVDAPPAPPTGVRISKWDGNAWQLIASV